MIARYWLIEKNSPKTIIAKITAVIGSTSDNVTAVEEVKYFNPNVKKEYAIPVANIPRKIR